MNKDIATLKTKRRIALIDADGILFAAACSAECGTGDGDFLALKSPQEAYNHVLDRFKEIILKTDSETAIICLTSANNWRKKVMPGYKSNRLEKRLPELLKVLREMLQEDKPYPIMCVATLEADDVCGISAGNLSSETVETVICSPDKDLRQIPGLLYTCRADSVVEEITEDAADYFHYWQALVGDPIDGYAGLPKVGKVKAAAILLPATLDGAPADGSVVFSKDAAWRLTKEAYNNRGFDDDYLLQMMRVSRILRSSDWNNETHEVILWEPPELTPTE